MSRSQGNTPTRLRATLATIFISLLALAVVIFMLGYQQITDYSRASQQTALDAQNSNSQVQRLIATKKQLEENADVVARASQLVSVSKSYLYQDQIINDINSYAAAAGISLESITFNDKAAGATTATAAAPAGIKTTTATITLKNPVNYMKYLKFIHSLEQSLFRMSVLGVSIAKSTSLDELKNDPQASTAEPVEVEVYIK